MTEKEVAMSSQLKALKTTDLSPLIRMADLMTPRMLSAFLPKLDAKQRTAFDKVMPAGGEKQIYLQMVDTPTPPIVIRLAQPLKMSPMAENKVKQQKIRGIRLTINDIQLLSEGRTLGNMLRLVWRLKGQIGTFLSLSGMLIPFILLGPAELKDMQNRAMTHFKPMLDLMPRQKK
jgi:hypothetical protein